MEYIRPAGKEMRMLKVLQVNDYPSSAGGGAEVVLERTMQLLRPHTAQVEVFTSADLADARLTPRRYVDNPVARRALAARLETLRPDIVHLHNFYHVLSPGILLELQRYRRRRPLRVVMTAHDYHLVCPNSGGNWFEVGATRPIDPKRIGSLRYLLSRRWDERGSLHSLLKTLQHLWNYRWRGVFRTLDLIICPSRYVERLLQPLGVATLHLPNPTPVAQSEGLRPKHLRLIFAGRLVGEKGMARLIEQLPATFQGELAVIGTGPEELRCRRAALARGLGSRVRFLGRLPHAQTLAEIAQSHVLVLPSLCLEGAPLTLIEALAAGTNVLASNFGGMREIVESAGVGYLFDPVRPQSLLEQLTRIEVDHREGRLNRFEIASFLAARTESYYLAGLLQAYRGGLAA
jgi:glycosyltransferase involved in cell wall biosynthesis